MKNHNWKLLGLTLALALLFACLFGGAALAELHDLEIYIDHQVEAGEELDIGFNPARDDNDNEVIPTLSVTCLNDGTEVNTDVVPCYVSARRFVMPTDDLVPGNVYCVKLTATKKYNDPISVEDCFRVESSHDFGAWLDVENEDPRTNESVRCHINFNGNSRADWVGLYDGQECIDEWSGEELDDGYVEYWFGRENEAEAKLYVRARFYDRFKKQDVWVSSDVRFVRVHATNKYPIEDAVLTDASKAALAGATRGDVLRLAVEPIEIDEYAWVGVEITSDELGTVYRDRCDPQNIQIPTAELPSVAYELYVWWISEGYPVDGHGEPTAFTLGAYTAAEPLFGLYNATPVADKPNEYTVAPDQWYSIYGYVPGADALCIYEDWDVRQDSRDKQGEYDSIAFWDSSYDLQTRAYYLGIGTYDGDRDEWTWRRTDKCLKVHIESDKRLPELGLTLSAPDDQGNWIEIGSTLYEGKNLRIDLPMLAPLSDEGYQPRDMNYRLEIWDRSRHDDDPRWSDDFRLYADTPDDPDTEEDEGDYGGHNGAYSTEFNWDFLEKGHEYVVYAVAWYGDYPVRVASRSFATVPDYGWNPVTLRIDGDDMGVVNLEANQDVTVEVTVPEDVAAIQIYWDGEWRGPDRDWKVDDTTWRWTDSLGGQGEQDIFVRATCLDAQDDEWEDWNDEEWSRQREYNWDYYSNVVPVDIQKAEVVTLPDFEIKNANNSVARGENLIVFVGPCEDSIRAYELEFKGQNEWGEYWDDFDDLRIWCDDPAAMAEGREYAIPTGDLEAGRTYRVRLQAHAKQGFRSDDSAYEDPDFYFTVTEPNSEYGITVTGRDVTWNEPEQCYEVPTCSDYTITGFATGADEVCLYEWEDCEDEDDTCDEWQGDSFIWRNSDDRRTTYRYALGVRNEEGRWVKRADDAFVTISIKAPRGDLEPAKFVNTAPTAQLYWNDEHGRYEGEYTFSFRPVENARSYYLELADDRFEWDGQEYNWKRFYEEWFELDWDDGAKAYVVNPDRLPDGVTYDEADNRFDVTVKLPLRSWEFGDVELPSDIGQVCIAVINAQGDGWNKSRVEYTFITVGDNIDRLDLNIEDSLDGDDGFYVNIPVTFRIGNFPGRPDELQYLWEGDWWRNVDLNDWDDEAQADFWDMNYDGADNSLTLENWDSIDEPGTQNVMVRARYGGNWVYSDPIEVNFALRDENMALVPPMPTIEQNVTLNRGEPLQIEISEMTVPNGVTLPEGKTLKDMVECYRLEVFDLRNGNECHSEECDFGTTAYSLNTMSLNGGAYHLRLRVELTDEARREGWYCPNADDLLPEGDKSLQFNIRDFDTDDAMIYVNIDGQRFEPGQDGVVTVPVWQYFEIEAVIPGWDNDIGIFWNDDGDPEWRGGGSYCSGGDEWQFANECTYTVGVWDYVQEEWVRTGPSVTVRSESVSELARPEIEAAGVFEWDDNGYAFRVTAPSVDVDGNPVDGPIRLGWHDQDGNWEAVPEDGIVTVPADRLNIGDVYRFGASAVKSGYEGGYDEWTFLVVGGADNEVTLKVNGQSDSVAVVTKRSYRIELDTRGQEYERIRMYWGQDDWDWGWPWDWKNNKYIQENSFGSGEHKVVVAVGNVVDWDENGDEIIDWRYSNVVTVTATGNGQIDLPVVTLDRENMTVTLSGITDEMKARTRDYGISIWPRNDSGPWYSIQDGNLETDELMDEDAFEPVPLNLGEVFEEGDDNRCGPIRPGEYRVHVHANGKPGWDDNWTDGGCEDLWFDIPVEFGIQAGTPNDDVDGGWEWTDPADSVEVAANQEVRVHAVLGEGGYRVHQAGREDWDWNWLGEWDNDGNIYVTEGAAGDYTFELYRWEDYDGYWHWRPVEGMTVAMHVGDSDISDPVIRVSDTITEDQDALTFSFDEVTANTGKTVRYDVNVHNDGADLHLFGDGGLAWSANDTSWEGYTRSYNGEDDNNGASITYTPGENGNPGKYEVSVPMAYYDWNDLDEEGNPRRDARIWNGDHIGIDVNARSSGVGGSGHDRRDVVVAKASTGIVTLSVDQTELQAQERLGFQINIDGNRDFDERDIHDVEFRCNNDWGYFNDGFWPFEGDDYPDYHDCSFTRQMDGGVYTFQIRMWLTDGEGNSDWYYSDPVTVTVKGKDLALPGIGLREVDEENCLPRGKQLGVYFSHTPEGARNYHISIIAADDDDDQPVHEIYPAKNGKVLLPTGNLRKNREYRVNVWVEAEVGYNNTWTEKADEKRFTVISGQAAFSATKTDPYTQEEVILSAYVPGAEALRMEARDEEYWEDSRDEWNNNMTWHFQTDRPATYTFRLLQWIDGDWRPVTYYDDAGEEQTVQPIVVGVRTRGDLDKAVILAVDGVNKLPTKLEQGADLEFRVIAPVVPDGSATPRYAQYSVDVRNEYNDWINWNYDDTEGVYTVSADDLELDRTYKIYVHAWEDQYSASDAEAEFAVVKPVPDEVKVPALSMTLNGQSDSEVTWPASKDYTVEFAIIQPDGVAEPIEAEELQIMWDGDWRNMTRSYNNNCWYDGEWHYIGNLTQGGYFYNQDGPAWRNLKMRARFVVDDNNDETDDNIWVYSEPIVLTVESRGFVNKPVVSLIDPDYNEDGEVTVARNNPLRFNIALPGEDGADDRTGVNQLSVVLYNNDDGEFGSRVDDFYLSLSADAVTGEIAVSDLEEGWQYRLAVNADPGEGYEGRESDYDDGLIFRVGGADEAAEPTLIVNKTSVATMENFTVSGYIPDENRVALFCKNPGDSRWYYDEEWDGDHIVVNRSFSTSGVYTYALAVWNHYRNDWQRLDEPVVTVTVKKGKALAKPEVSCPDLVKGEAFTFTVNKVDNATEYYVGMQDKYGNRLNNPDQSDQDVYYTANEFGNAQVITVPADVLSGYSVGDKFTIYAYAGAPGYEGEAVNKVVQLDPAPVENPEVTLTLSSSATEAYVCEPIAFTLSYAYAGGEDPGLTDVEINVGDTDEYGDYMWYSMEPSSDAFTYDMPYGRDYPGTLIAFARAKVGGSDEYTYSKSVGVEIKSEGVVPNFTATVSPMSLRKGENVTVTIDVADRTVIAGFRVYIQGDEGYDYDQVYNGGGKEAKASATSITLSTADLAPDHNYRVVVQAIGIEHYQDRWVGEGQLGFRVRPRLVEDASFTPSATVVMTDDTHGVVMADEQYGFVAYVPGAVRLELFRDDDEAPCASCDSDTLDVDHLTGEGTYRLDAYDENSKMDTQLAPISIAVHEWADAADYEFNEETRIVTRIRRCNVNGCAITGHTDTDQAKATLEETMTCTEAGSRKWTATFRNPDYVWTDEQPVEALGHAWGETAYEWTELSDGWSVKASHTCERCGETKDETVGAVFGETTPATCDKDGVGTWTATFEGFDPDARTVSIPKTGHDWEHGQISYKWSDDFRKVTATLTCANGCGKTVTETADATLDRNSADTFDATCETEGRKHWVSDDFVEHPDLFEVQQTNQTLAPLGHDWEVTFTWDVYTAMAEATCRRDASHTIPQSELHVTMSDEVTTQPTCTDAGERTYTATVTVDGKEYTDTRTETIDATGHSWNAPEYVWSDDNATVTAKVTCKNGDHPVTETVNTTVDTVDATYTEKGRITYTAAFDNALFETQTKVVEIPVKVDQDVQAVVNQINALPANAGTGDKAAVEAARAAYNALTENQKKLIGADVLNKLTTAESQVKAAEEAAKQAADDAAAAKAVADQINALPANAGTGDKAAVEAARAAYNALTENQKKLVSADVLNRLTTAEAQVKAAEEAAIKKAEDKAAAQAVIDKINALPSKAGVADKKKVKAARTAYDALTKDQKALISAKVLKKLTTAEAQVKAAEAEAKKIKIGKCKITVANLTYTGKTLKPKVTVKYNNKTLKQNTDYSLTYDKKMKKIGTWTVTVTGKGNYTGSKDLKFKINPKGTKFGKETKGKNYIKLKWSKPSNIAGYQIQYSLKNNFSGKKTVKITNPKTVSTTIKGLQAGKTYYLRIRTYQAVSGTTYYSDWSATKTVKTNSASKKNDSALQVEMDVGEELDLKEVLPKGAAVEEWTTSDAEIAMVSRGGVVTALKPGEAVVTAICGDGGQINITVTVSSEGIILLDLGEDLSILDIDDVFGGDVDIEANIELPGA